MLYILPLDACGMDGLDETDLRLIRLLQVNGRTPFSQLAQQTGLPERHVARKVAQLAGDGVIQIAPVCNPSVLGLRSVAMVAIRLNGRSDAGDFAVEILARECIDYVAVTLGVFDLLVEVLAEDDTSLRRLIQEHIRSRPEVESVEVLPYIGLSYQQPVWDETQDKIGAGVGVYRVEDKELDLIDRKLVALLGADGRATFQALAAELGVSESYVRKRFAGLTARQDFGVHALTNPRSLGFRTTCWVFLKVAQGASTDAMIRGLARLERVAYVAFCTGTADLLVEVVCRNKDELRNWFSESLGQVEGVHLLRSLLCTDIYYRSVNYAPGG